MDVIIDHIGLADLRSTFAAEVAAGKGHDIVEFIDPPSDFEPSVMDLTDLNQEAVRNASASSSPLPRAAPTIPIRRSTTASATAGPSIPGDYRKSLWEKAGKPDGPATWEDLLIYGAKIKNEQGVQLGIGISQELDSNMAERTLLWSFDTLHPGRERERGAGQQEDRRGGEVHDRAVPEDA